MSKIPLYLLLGLFMLVLSGCFHDTSETDVNINTALETNTNTNAAVNTNVTTPDAVARFYPTLPDTSGVTGGGTTPSEPVLPIPKDFIVTQELQAKIYLVDKYDPGTCYGAPVSVPDSAVKGMIDRNPDLASFVRAKDNLGSDLAVYNKIKQLNGIRLETIVGGSYTYNFVDGQCCVLKAYQGEINIVGRTTSDTITRQETKENPC